MTTALETQRELVYEFYQPFAHVPGRYEACRIRSPTHGVFDCFIVLDPAGTHPPATVYVADDDGQRFMADRYPESFSHRVPTGALRLQEKQGGRTLKVELDADDGPLRSARLRFSADEKALPRHKAYGGHDEPVWGSRRFSCWGVDLVLDCRVEGRVVARSGDVDRFDGDIGLLTLGSFGRIGPLGGI